MYIPFENLPEESKIWIYQSNRKFSDAEFSEIETDVRAFLDSWEAHSVSSGIVLSNEIQSFHYYCRKPRSASGHGLFH